MDRFCPCPINPAARSYTGFTPIDVDKDVSDRVGDALVCVGGFDGPLSGEVATSAMHQMRGLIALDVDVVGLVTSQTPPTSGCRSRSRDVGRTQEKALRASTSRRERKSAMDDGGAAGMR